MHDWPRLLAVVAGGAGAAVSCGAIIYAFMQWLSAKQVFARPGRHYLDARMPEVVRRLLLQEANSPGKGNAPRWFNDWTSFTRERMARAGVRVPVGRYVAGVVLAAGVGLVTGTALLNNLPAALVLAASAFLVPDILLRGRAQARRAKLVEQMGVAARIFASEFADTPQVLVALSRTADSLPSPLGSVFQRAVRDLTAGRDRDEVLLRLMEELDFAYGRMFVQLLRIAWEDASVRPLFTRLATRISSLHALTAQNRSQTATSRWMAMAINAAVLPMFFLSRILVPDAGRFMTNHPVGKLMVFVLFLSVLVGLIMDRVLTEVDV